jgi:ankyrin repeat protein
MKLGKAGIVFFLAVAPMGFGAAGDELFRVVRVGDAGQVKALLQSGADPNVRDDLGATPLMYAGALPAQDCVRALLEGGADVNAMTPTGSTALMWATGQPATVRLLIDHGADVNAKTKSGTTALLTATRRANVESMKILLARGANPKVGTADGSDLLKSAYVNLGAVTNGLRTNPEVVRILAEAGVPLKSADQLGPPALFAGLGDAAITKSIIDSGANPNAVVPGPAQSVTALQIGITAGDKEFVRALLDRGADANGKSSRDVTALMTAVNAPRPDPAMVRMLMEKGAEVNARDKQGRSVLDWAMMQGETEIARMLRAAGARSGAGGSAAAPATIAQPRTAHLAMEKAIPQLQPIGPVFNKHSGCISCHNESLPAIAVKLAAAREVSIDANLATHPSQATLDFWKRGRENLMLGLDGGIAGFIENTTYGLWALVEEGVPGNVTTDAVVYRLLELQKPDGSWTEFDSRPPLGGISPIKFTALAIRGADTYAPPALQQEVKVRIAKAQEYLRNTTPEDTQDEAFRLLGLVWSGAPASDVVPQSGRVKALQRPDGGWSQLPAMNSEAYSTGQALYALRIAGVSNEDSVHRNGIAYLLRTQLEDGTWFVRSRATIPIQAYFESGFPHGTDQFISAAGTSWAVMALAGSIEN